MSKENQQPEETQEHQPMSAEEKFFGVKTTIDKDAPDDDDGFEVFQQDDEEPRKKSLTKGDNVEDDDGDELENYSDRVQKRIKKMTWEKNEERRQREAAEQMREEAVRFAQQLQQRNQQYEQVIHHGEAYVIQQVKDRAKAMVERAQDKYRKAYEEGDTDAIIAAQEELLNAKAEAFSVGHQEQNYQQRAQQWQQMQRARQMQPQRPQQQPQVPRPTPRATEWAQENPWFGDEQHKDMTALAYGIHEKLVREDGLQPDSDKYYQEIDRRMQQRFPEYFSGEQGQVTPTSTRRKSDTVVAPAARNNGAKPRQVKLTSTQLALAKKLGLTPEQYARELTKEMYNG